MIELNLSNWDTRIRVCAGLSYLPRAPNGCYTACLEFIRMSKDTFDILFLIARPAAGKSEIIDYLKRTPEGVRRAAYHIGPFTELDDFPILWEWFEEDDILDRMGLPRLHSDAEGYFRFRELWHVLIERLGVTYGKLLRDRPDFHEAGGTAIVEFARGAEHGGFAAAFDHFPEAMLARGAILYVDVSWEESLRKNRARFNPARPDSILEHGLQDGMLERLYRDSDWPEFSGGNPDVIQIKSVPVPYAIFPNTDDVTTGRGPALGARLEQVLGKLWRSYALHKEA